MERNLIGKQIQKYREQAGLKQEELAELIGKSPIFVSYMERGIRKPGLDTLLTLSEALDVSIDILLGNRASPALVSRLALIQEMLDAMLPNLLPVLFTCLVFWLIKEKKWTTYRLVILTIIVGILLSVIGFLG